MSDVILQTTIAGQQPTRGKVRDIYDLGDSLLFVASDRISAFDVVLPNGIPGKGKVLTQTSLFWFDYLKDTVDNHLITANIDEYPEDLKKYVAMGADLVCYGAKYFGGPNSAGILCGRKDLVAAAQLQTFVGFESQGIRAIGRGMKLAVSSVA